MDVQRAKQSMMMEYGTVINAITTCVLNVSNDSILLVFDKFIKLKFTNIMKSKISTAIFLFHYPRITLRIY
jgi:hypothetical protein